MRSRFMRSSLGQVAGIAAAFSIGVTERGFASCPDYNPPHTPTLAEARTSRLCIGTPHEARVAELQRATPEADAKQAADRRQFKLLASATPFSWDGHICTVAYEEDNTVACALQPAMRSQKVDRDIYHAAFDQIPKRNYPERAPVSCATVLGRLLADYTGRFNRALVTDPRYPNRDICRAVEAKPQIQSGPLAQPTEQSILVQPSIEQRPPVYTDVAAAARFGDIAAVKRQISAGQDAAARDEFGLTALDWAVIRALPAVQEALLDERGTTLDACTAMWYAITHKRLVQADALVTLCAGQRGPAAQNNRNIVVNLAASKGHAALLSAMRAAGVDLMAAAPEMVDLKAAQERRDDGLDFIDKIGIGGEDFAIFAAGDPGHPIPQTACALNRAASAGHVEIVRDVLDYGVAVDAICNSFVSNRWWPTNRRALLDSVASDKKDVVALLLGRGARAGGLDPLSESMRATIDASMPSLLRVQGPPLALALSSDRRAPTWPPPPISMDIVELLLKHGASLNELGPHGAPAFYSLLSTLTWPPPIADPFSRLYDKLEVDARMIEPPAVLASQRHPSRRLGLVPSSGRTLLMEALLGPRLDAEKHKHFDPDTTKGQPEGVPLGVPLANSAKVFRLLGANADPRLADDAGQTALHYAASLDHGTAAALALIEAGADVNARDKAGKSPLDHATARKALRMAAFLRSQGGK